MKEEIPKEQTLGYLIIQNNKYIYYREITDFMNVVNTEDWIELIEEEKVIGFIPKIENIKYNLNDIEKSIIEIDNTMQRWNL